MLRLFQGPPDISLHRAPKKLDTALVPTDYLVAPLGCDNYEKTMAAP